MIQMRWTVSEATAMKGGVDVMQTTAVLSTDALLFALDVLWSTLHAHV